MFEKLWIKEHMEIADCNGLHGGTVDGVEDDRIRLTKSDSEDAKHHYPSMADADRLDDNRV